MNLETGESHPVTNSLSGISQFSLSSDGSKLAFSALENGGFDIFVMKGPADYVLADDAVPQTVFMKRRLAERSMTSKPAAAIEVKAAFPDSPRAPDST
ncbi:MAG: hypothetical protein M1339_00195, partial [Bacteroidetes bacterium]|nr:hypothetical protein [Bacteroidota bacterium]